MVAVVIPEEGTELMETLRAVVEQAELGNIDWLTVAIQQRALTGLVMPGVWKMLTPKQKKEVGTMSQTKARGKLGLR